MQIIPRPLQQLIDALTTLPGVGPRSAERFAYFLLQSDQPTAGRLAEALAGLHKGVSYCQKTFALVDSETDVSPLYTDPSRDRQTIAVVADPFDIIAIEKTSQYAGTYHVLGGLISPIDGLGPEDLHVKELLNRIEEDDVTEVIIATNASVEGESTALYIQKHIKSDGVKVTRLARGLPVGVDLEYADQITLGRALEGRTLL
jgi:recombination protein RecR